MSDAGVSRSTLLIFLFIAAFLIALGVVRATIAYAHRRGMLDLPGQRRSHTIPTPRGGGLGVIVAILVTSPVCLVLLGNAWPGICAAAFMLAIALVAAVGWWDDHHALPVLPRFAVQLLGAAIFSVAVIATGLAWWWLPLMILAGAWSINLHNFMDGIDGLLAQQSIFVGAGLALMAFHVGQTAIAGAASCVVAACFGFWCYNRSPARIFMGDVGSGTLGLIIFALSALLWRVDHTLLWPAMILSSAFLTDATVTLLLRFLHGRRWYTAHREHLYQWMVRRGHTHAQGAAWYLGWNLLVAAPLAVLALERPRIGFAICVALYLLSAGLWLGLKRRLLRRDRYKVRHVHT